MLRWKSLDSAAVALAVGESAGLVAEAVKSALATVASRVSNAVVTAGALVADLAAVGGVRVGADARVLAVLLVKLESEVEVALRNPFVVLAERETVLDVERRSATAQLGVGAASVANGVEAAIALEGALAEGADGVSVGDLDLGARGVEEALLGLAGADTLVALAARRALASEVTSTLLVAEWFSKGLAAVALLVSLALDANVIRGALCKAGNSREV